MTRPTLFVDFASGPDEDGKVQAIQGSYATKVDASDIRAAIARGERVEEWVRVPAEPTADNHDCRGEAECTGHPDCEYALCPDCRFPNGRCRCP